MPCCAAVSCSNRRENGIRLFRFPPDKERCKLWITKVKRDNWTPAPSSRLCEKHFDESQFESHRQDGWKKLRQNAVPTLFPHIALVRVRKRPAKRSPQVSPSKHLCLERIRVEHPYSTTSIFPSSSTSNESSGAQHEYDVKDNTTNDAVTYPSASTMSPLDDVHSVTYCSSTKASDTAATIDCVDCQTLKSNISKLQKQLALKNRLLSQMRKKHKVSLRKIRKHTKDRVAVSGAVKIFLNVDQQNCLKKTNRRGAKWSSSTVKNALQLHFACGRTGYGALLSQQYPLPSLRTLRRSIQFVKFHSGILTEVFTFLSIKVKVMTSHERECCLTLDEMSITDGVDFDTRTGQFIGDVTLPSHAGVATHSLVFLLGGISTRWKQTIAYYFTSNSTDGTVFATIVLDIVNRCHEIGLNVAAVTSDMGSANQAMWKKLGIKSGKKAVTVNYFLHPCNPEKKIFVLADVPHIIKNIRNHLVNGQIFVLPPCIVQKFDLPCDTVSIEPLKKLVEYQKDKDLKPAPNLTAKHIDPSHFDKMKVSQALNIFSHSVSSALRHMIDTQSWDLNMLTTCWFIELMNKWFDLMSSRHAILGISRFVEEKYNSTISFLLSVIEIFDNMEISRPGAAAPWKPVQSGVILSTMSVLQLQDRLR